MTPSDEPVSRDHILVEDARTGTSLETLRRAAARRMEMPLGRPASAEAAARLERALGGGEAGDQQDRHGDGDVVDEVALAALSLGEEVVDASSAPSTKIDVFVPSRTPAT